LQNDLQKKDQAWTWGPTQIESFQQLKYDLTTEPVLQFADFTRPIILTTDASWFAVGAILSEAKIGQNISIACASRILNKAEKSIEKEFATIVWACKHLRVCSVEPLPLLPTINH